MHKGVLNKLEPLEISFLQSTGLTQILGKVAWNEKAKILPVFDSFSVIYEGVCIWLQSSRKWKFKFVLYVISFGSRTYQRKRCEMCVNLTQNDFHFCLPQCEKFRFSLKNAFLCEINFDEFRFVKGPIWLFGGPKVHK